MCHFFNYLHANMVTVKVPFFSPEICAPHRQQTTIILALRSTSRSRELSRDTGSVLISL